MSGPLIFISRSRVKPSEVQIFGTPSDDALAMLRQFGIDVRLLPRHDGGFLRPQPE